MTDINLDREDAESIAEGTRHNWSTLEYGLGLNQLPRIEQLAGADTTIDQDVARSIVGLLTRVRGSVSANLQARLEGELRAERERSVPGAPAGTTAAELEQRAITVAEAYLRVINRTVERRDVERIVRELPASIRPTDVGPNQPRVWTLTNVRISRTQRANILVDLDHPIWRSGSEQDIRRRLNGLTAAQAGVTVNTTTPPAYPANAPLDPAVVRHIFDTQRNVIDPALPIRPMEIDGLPNPGERVIFDMPALLRDNPPQAESDLATLSGFLATPANYDLYVRRIDIATGAQIANRLNNTDINNMLTQVFGRLSRNVARGSPFASRSHSLTTALAARQSVDSLLRGSADNRELLLALSAIQRDPSATEALGSARTRQLLDTRRNLENERSLRIAIDTLMTLSSPGGGRTRGAIQTEITTLNAATPPVGTRDLNGWAQEQKRKEEVLKQEMSNLEKCIECIAQVQSSIRTWTLPSISPTAALVIAATNIETHVTTAINNFSARSFASDVVAAVNAADATGPGKSALLGTKEFYDQRLTENETQVRAAESEVEQNGSEACWAIVRRELENRGMRSEQVDKVVQVTRNQLQHSGASTRDVEDLSRGAFTYDGDSNNEARSDWNADKRYAGITKNVLRWTIGLPLLAPLWTDSKSHTLKLQTYVKNLFTRENIGLTLGEANSAMSRQFSLSHLLDAYFRTKYLLDLPPDNPLHLPESQEIITFMRNLHAAILERSQLSFQNASGGNQAELATVGIKPNMTKTERLQAVHSHLLSGKDTYVQQHKPRIERMAKRAFAPLQKKIDSHKYWSEGWKNRGKNLLGEGSVLNPLTTPAKIGKTIFRILNTEI